MNERRDDRNGLGPTSAAPGNPELLAELQDLENGDPSIGEHRRVATYTIQLDAENGLASVHEDMERTSRDGDVQWLQVFAGVIAVMRFSAFFEAREATEAVMALSHANTQPDSDWVLVADADELREPTSTLEVEICVGEPSGLEGAFIRLDAESAKAPRTKTDLLLVFRGWLLEQRNGQIPRVARSGLNVLCFAAATDLLDASTLNDQLVAPLRVMQVLEREGFVYPHLGDDPLPNMDGSDGEDERWSEVTVGFGGMM